MGLRREARETALKVLYVVDVANLTKEEATFIITNGNTMHVHVKSFMDQIVSGTLENTEEIDSQINKYTQNWNISRMAAIDRNIIRIGAFEILKTPETPISVIIDEAVEIAKKYSTSDSGKFVNGILDKIKQAREVP
ncbi:MAG: transcription antitermination factor NusB [Elusimicrobia bacterium]|nr:transcription antitermination factor NusB [Elusimicrobiota bacterium]MBU2613944.1 transcription antitermination factor NusB [Elusimicrobiota bacterium]